LGKFLCLIAAIQVMGGFCAIMQSIAWATMLCDRIPQQGISEALDTTFSGEYPCEKCRAIAMAKAEAEKRERQESQIPEFSPLAKVTDTRSRYQRIRITPPPAKLLLVGDLDQRGSPQSRPEVPTPPPRFIG